jgi:hypothetical protein
MPYDYRHVKDAYDTLRDAGIVTDTLPDWSAKMNAQTGTDDYAAGLHDDWIKQASVGVDRLLEMTGLPQLGGEIGRGVGELVGNPEAGERIGRGLPRLGASMIPLAIPGLQPLAPLTMAASAGTEAYTETGSPAAGLIAAGTAGLMPTAGNLARQAALKGMGAEVAEGALLKGGGTTVDEILAKLQQGAVPKIIKERVPTTFGQALGAYGAEQAGAAAVGEVGHLAGDLYSGGSFKDYIANISPTEQLLNLTLGQAPFAGASIARHGLAGFGGEAARRHLDETRATIKLTEDAQAQKTALEEAAAKTPVEDIPDTAYGTPEELLARNTRINELRSRQRAATDEGTSFSEEERQKLLDEEEGLVKQQGYAPGNILGANIDPTTARRAVTGTEVAYDPELKFRRVQLDDNPANGDLAGKQIGFSTEHEPPVGAEGTFSVPEGYHSEFLPTEGGRFDPEAKLNIAQQKLTAAKSNAELQQGIIELNHARQSYGLPALDDKMLSARTIELKLGGIRDAANSELERTRQLAKAKDEGQELGTLTQEYAQRQTEFEAATAARDDIAAQAASARQKELAARMSELHRMGDLSDYDRMREIANAPMTRENAPLKDRLNENAVRLAEASPLTGDDKQKFLTWMQFGKRGLAMKYDMQDQDVGVFLNQDHIHNLADKVAKSTYGGMDLQEYGERYLKSTGVSAEQAKAQTDRAVALSGRGDMLTEDLLKSKPVQPEVTKAQGEMQTAITGSPEAQERLKGRLDELGHANIDEWYNALVRGGHFDHEALDQLDTEVADYLYAKARDHQQTLDVLNAAGHKDIKADVPVEDIGEYTEGPTSAVKEVLKNGEGRARAAAAADGMTSIVPATFLSKAYNNLLSDPLSVVGDAIKYVKDWFKTPNYIAVTGGPEAKEFVSRSHQLESNIKKMEAETMKTFWLDNDGKWTDQYVDALKNPAVRNSLNKWIDINMKRGQTANKIEMISPDDPAVAKLMKGLSEEQKANVKGLMDRVVSSNAVNAAQQLEKMESIAVTEGARILNPVMGQKTNQNVALAKAVMDGMSQPENPQAYQQGQRALQRIFDMSPDKVAEIQDHFNAELGKINEERAHFAANPAQVTQEMYGKWDVVYKKGGREYFTRVDTRAAAQELGDSIVTIKRNDSDGDTRVDYRAKVAGGAREPIMWFENQFTGNKQNAAYWSRALFRAQTKLLRESPELMQRPDMQRFIDAHAENLLQPDPELGKFMSRMASTWFLGGNVASAIANGTQMFTRGAAELTRITGKPIDSFKRVIDAMREVGEASLDPSKWRSPDHEWLIKKYELDKTGTNLRTPGLLAKFSPTASGESAYDVVGDRENNITLKMKWALNHGRPQSIAQRSDSMLHRFNDTIMLGYRAVESVNTQSAMISAFDFYRSAKGGSLSKEEAYRKAEEFNWAVNDPGGKGNRPILAFSTMPKSAAMVMNSLQSFNIGTVGQIAKLIKQSFNTTDFTPAERWNARKATAQLFVVQGALAGVLGVPFASSIVAGLEQVFPSLELQKNIRQLVQKLTFEDQSHDTPLSDLAMNGIPSMFGWDFQSRLSMGNTVPGLSEINGFQPDMMHTAPVQILTKFLQGGQKLIDRDFMGAAKDMTPPALAKIIAAYGADKKVIDYTGKPIAGGDRTWGELTGQVLGFQPTRLSDYYEMNRITKHADNQRRKLDAKFNQDLGQNILDGKFGDAKQKLIDRGAQEPKYDKFEGGRKAVEAAMEMHFPRDLRKQLNKNDTEIARMLPVNYGLPTETDRQKFREVALRQLGIPMKKKDWEKYRMVDQVYAENPEYTKEEAYREAERRMGKVRKVRELAASPEEETSVAQILP